MPLAHEDIEFIKEHLGEWLSGKSMGQPPVVYEIELRERSVRVEEELKHQRELMMQGFEQMNQRFEAMQEQMNQRFEAMQEQMNQRFEQVDKRFEQVDKRFEQVNQRFEQVDKRFEALTLRMDRFMVWSFGITITVGGVVIAAIRYYTQAG